jgi:hypothetical protein
MIDTHQPTCQFLASMMTLHSYLERNEIEGIDDDISSRLRLCSSRRLGLENANCWLRRQPQWPRDVGEVIRLILGLEGKKKCRQYLLPGLLKKGSTRTKPAVRWVLRKDLGLNCFIKNFEKWHAVQLICCVRECVYQETIYCYWFNQ